MDITNFINSRDIRDYHRQIGYKYSALEAAWIVYYCRDISVKQKHEAWNWIIDNMSDCMVSTGRIHNCFHGKSTHKVIAEYIKMENEFIDRFMTESGYLFTYKPYCKCLNGYDACKNDGVFSNAQKSIEHILKDEDSEDCIFAEIERKIPDCGDYYNIHGSIVIDLNGEILDIDVDLGSDPDNREIDLKHFFDDLWFEFPVPFKRGDIVFLRNRLREEDPILLTDIVVPSSWEREKYIEMRSEHGGDYTDMNLYGYAMGDSTAYSDTSKSHYIGVYSEVWFNYMDAEYYRKELTGTNRILKVISNWLKGEFGDDLCLLLAGYHRIMMEEYLSTTTPVMFTDEGLRLAGFSKDNNKGEQNYE